MVQKAGFLDHSSLFVDEILPKILAKQLQKYAYNVHQYLHQEKFTPGTPPKFTLGDACRAKFLEQTVGQQITSASAQFVAHVHVTL